MFRAWMMIPILTSCDADVPAGQPSEAISTITLTFTPATGGAPLVFEASDPELTGDVVTDPIELSDAVNYDLEIRFFDDSAGEDLTPEIEREGAEHQVFIVGGAVLGPASASTSAVVTHAYADFDAGGLPIGLENTIVTAAEGEGDFEVILRHLPPEGGVAVKSAGLAELVASGGLGAIAGQTDVRMIFPLTVVP